MSVLLLKDSHKLRNIYNHSDTICAEQILSTVQALDSVGQVGLKALLVEDVTASCDQWVREWLGENGAPGIQIIRVATLVEQNDGVKDDVAKNVELPTALSITSTIQPEDRAHDMMVVNVVVKVDQFSSRWVLER
jgi:hypothetical protein